VRRPRSGSRAWREDAGALGLLAGAGPFDSPEFRRLWLRSFPAWRDVSYGAGRSDGTRAAVALLAYGRETAESIPFNYGGVVASKPLGPTEIERFLEAARRSAGVRRITVRSVPVLPVDGTRHTGGAVRGWTSVVYLGKGAALESRFAQKARRSIRIARAAGAEVIVTDEPDAFLDLYGGSAADHCLQYPDDLIQGLAREGAARFFDVQVEHARVSSVLALTSRSHWMAWLAAQDETGRRVHGNYLAVSALLKEAARSGIRAVDLGISHGLPPGVAHFKQRFDSVYVPVAEHRVSTASARLNDWARARRSRVVAAASRRLDS
jgi:hypothetical protein